MALGKQRIRTNVKGGGTLKLRILHPTPVDVFTDVGYLGGTNLDDTRNMVQTMDERGLVIDYEEGSSEPVLKCVLHQSAADEINLVKDADGKYYEAYYVVKTAEGKFQELDIPIVKIKCGAILEFAAAKERTIDLEMHMLAVVTIGATITRAPTGFNMDTTVNPYYVLVENAAAINAPSDAGATVKTAVF